MDVARTHAQWAVGPSGTTVKVALTRPVTVILRARITRADEDLSTLLNYALVEPQTAGAAGRTPSWRRVWNFAEAGR